MSTKPLISFYIIAYNHERFIAEAIAGAFAQTWTPLEIVLSDDCSDDTTFEIMKRMAGDYKGPHSIVLNRNGKNLGVGAHINRIMQLCTGEWIVASAGDDVSMPERTERLYSYWESQAKKTGLVFSNLIEINEEGSFLYKRDFRKEVPGGCASEHLSWNYRERLAQKCPPIHGSSFGYPRRIFDDFGPHWDDIVFEDAILNWRAEMREKVSLCPEYLVRHRSHAKQITNIYSDYALKNADTRRRDLQQSILQVHRQKLADTKFALEKGWISDEVYRLAEPILSGRLHQEELNFRLYWGSFVQRWVILLSNWRVLTREKRLSEILYAALPRPLYIFTLRLKTHRMKYFMQTLRKFLGKAIRAFLPARWIRILRDPVLLPGYYKNLAHEIEPMLDSVQTRHNNAPEYLTAMLRKYVHILDKGLDRPDFEPGHSKQWYKAAAAALDELGNNYDSDPSVTWAKEKVLEYEQRQINPARPESREQKRVSEEDYHTLIRMIKERRSVRDYATRPIEIDKLKIIIEALNWSPTSCNRQPAKAFIANEPELVRQCAQTCAGATCFSGEGACFISFCADMRVYNLPDEYLIPDLDLGLGIQNCLLVAHALGLSMTLLSWAQHTREDDAKLRNLLGIPSHYRIVVNSLSGYPAHVAETPPRKTLESTAVFVKSKRNE
jgi:glycosyltransferase involved in cell wall biosynthesis